MLLYEYKKNREVYTFNHNFLMLKRIIFLLQEQFEYSNRLLHGCMNSTTAGHKNQAELSDIQSKGPFLHYRAELEKKKKQCQINGS